jgi:hypothetical protein
MIFRSICVINLSNFHLENVMFSDFGPLTKLSKLTIKNKLSHSIQYFLVIYIFCIFNLFLQVPHVERKLLTLPEYPNSPPVFSGVSVARSLVSCVMFCISLFVLFFFCPLHVLSVLRFTASDFVSSNFFLPRDSAAQGYRLDTWT